jgi:hypothetical protein
MVHVLVGELGREVPSWEFVELPMTDIMFTWNPRPPSGLPQDPGCPLPGGTSSDRGGAVADAGFKAEQGGGATHTMWGPAPCNPGNGPSSKSGLVTFSARR